MTTKNYTLIKKKCTNTFFFFNIKREIYNLFNAFEHKYLKSIGKHLTFYNINK